MKKFIFFPLLILYLTIEIKSQCEEVKDMEEIKTKLTELEYEIEEEIVFNDGYFEQDFETKEKSSYYLGYECSKDKNLNLCENFVAKYSILLENNPKSIKCFEVLEECDTSQFVIIMKLNKDIYEKIDITNSYLLTMKYVEAMTNYLLDCYETNLFPLSDAEDDETKLWTRRVGYLISHNNKMFIFPHKINLNTELEEKFVQNSIRDFFIFFKQLFFQGKQCFDINADFRRIKNENMIRSMTVDNFPQGVTNTANWIMSNIEGDMDYKHKVMMKFYVVAYCFNEIVYGEQALKNLNMLVDDDSEKNLLLTSKKEIAHFYDYFYTKINKEKSEMTKRKLVKKILKLLL